MILHGVPHGELEVRATQGGVRVSGRFPYNTETELARGRFERVAPEAFQWDDGALFLFQHDMARPLANVRSGSLELRQTPDALEVEAEIGTGTSWGRDFAEALRAQLVTGLSPGFHVPAGGESVERRGDGVLRTIKRAELVEISAVTRPAYSDAQLSARCWQPEQGDAPAKMPPLARWRL